MGKYEKISVDLFWRLVKTKYDYIVVCNAASVTGILAVFWMKLLRIPYCIEGDGGFARDGKGWKEFLKKIVISKAKLCFSTSAAHDNYYLSYGALKENIYRYPFTSLRKKDILNRPLQSEEKWKKRKALGITESCVVISVGSFVGRKGMDTLIEASAGLDKNLGIYIVGGVPTEQYLHLKEKYHMSHLHFIDFCAKDLLAEYYEAADLFVLATREDVWGLVINEAMAYALPVITTKKCGAGLELIHDYQNGLLVDADDVDGLRAAMEIFLYSKDMMRSCAECALETMKHYTIEDMAERHMEIFRTSSV